MRDEKVCDNVCLCDMGGLRVSLIFPREGIWDSFDFVFWEWLRPEKGIYGTLIFQKLLLLVRCGKLSEDFFLHLSNLKSLYLKIIFMVTLGFQAGPHTTSREVTLAAT